MTSRREVRRAPDEKIKSTPRQRLDGELYARPTPNPFTQDWCDGYDSGRTGSDGILGSRNPSDYWDGYQCGVEEKKELDKLGSSNT